MLLEGGSGTAISRNAAVPTDPSELLLPLVEHGATTTIAPWTHSTDPLYEQIFDLGILLVCHCCL